MLESLGISPAYIIDAGDPHLPPLTDEEHQYIYSGEVDEGGWLVPDAYGWTNPILDVLLKPNLLKYAWKGRGFCMVLRDRTSASKTLGTIIHEAGHYLSFYDIPGRDEPDTKKAAMDLVSATLDGRDVHGLEWLRATVHLWHRAVALGYRVPFGDTVCLEQYGYDRRDLLPLLNEAPNREHEPIERILRPVARVARANKKQAGKKPQVARGPSILWLGGQPVRCHVDGTIETFPDANGVGATRYRGIREFLDEVCNVECC